MKKHPSRRMLRLILAVVALFCAVPIVASAAGTGVATFGDVTVNYFTNGKTEIYIRKGPKVYLYATLTSAETTTLREVYTSTPAEADGGQTAGTGDAVDGTVTLPNEPMLGDLTD